GKVLSESAVREIRLLRSMSGVWKRSYGRPTKAPPDEKGGNRHGRPKTTAPHPDSTKFCRSIAGLADGRDGLSARRRMARDVVPQRGFYSDGRISRPIGSLRCAVSRCGRDRGA